MHLQAYGRSIGKTLLCPRVINDSWLADLGDDKFAHRARDTAACQGWGSWGRVDFEHCVPPWSAESIWWNGRQLLCGMAWRDVWPNSPGKRQNGCRSPYLCTCWENRGAVWQEGSIKAHQIFICNTALSLRWSPHRSTNHREKSRPKQQHSKRPRSSFNYLRQQVRRIHLSTNGGWGAATPLHESLSSSTTMLGWLETFLMNTETSVSHGHLMQDETNESRTMTSSEIAEWYVKLTLKLSIQNAIDESNQAVIRSDVFSAVWWVIITLAC